MKVKKLTRKAISILLTVVLSLSTMLTSIAATNLEWPNAGAINLNKSATPVEGEDNQWDITLTIEGKNIKKTTDVVFVLDKSGSMSGTPMSSLKTAANKALDSLLVSTSSTRVALVSFATNATTDKVFYTSATKDAAKAEIDNMNADGSTDGCFRKCKF